MVLMAPNVLKHLIIEFSIILRQEYSPLLHISLFSTCRFSFLQFAEFQQKPIGIELPLYSGIAILFAFFFSPGICGP